MIDFLSGYPYAVETLARMLAGIVMLPEQMYPAVAAAAAFASFSAEAEPEAELPSGMRDDGALTAFFGGMTAADALPEEQREAVGPREKTVRQDGGPTTRRSVRPSAPASFYEAHHVYDVTEYREMPESGWDSVRYLSDAWAPAISMAELTQFLTEASAGAASDAFPVPASRFREKEISAGRQGADTARRGEDKKESHPEPETVYPQEALRGETAALTAAAAEATFHFERSGPAAPGIPDFASVFPAEPGTADSAPIPRFAPSEPGDSAVPYPGNADIVLDRSVVFSSGNAAVGTVGRVFPLSGIPAGTKQTDRHPENRTTRFAPAIHPEPSGAPPQYGAAAPEESFLPVLAVHAAAADEILAGSMATEPSALDTLAFDKGEAAKAAAVVFSAKGSRYETENAAAYSARLSPPRVFGDVRDEPDRAFPTENAGADDFREAFADLISQLRTVLAASPSLPD